MLNEPEASPPEPTTSMASAGARTRSIFSRIAVTAPVISSTVSPRTRSAINRPPICEGVAAPDIMRSKPCAASSRVSGAPVADLAINALKSSLTPAPCLQHFCIVAFSDGKPDSTFPENALPRRAVPALGPACRASPGRSIPRRRDLEEILEDEMAMLGGDAFGMKLHAVHRQPGMRKPHDQPVVGLRQHRQITRPAPALDHERMTSGPLE